MTMHPYELQQHLQPRLAGQILQDIVWSGHGLNLGHLAPCCGRVVQAVRWLRGNGHVWLGLEGPQFDDEPPGLLLPAGPVERVSGYACAVYLWCSDGRLTLGICPESGRDAYAVPEALAVPEARLFLRVLEGNRKLPVQLTHQALGIPYRRARDICAGWDRAGWLEWRGRWRYVSPAGAREARRVLEMSA